MKIIKNIEIVRGETVSVSLTYKNKITDEPIPLDTCNVEYEILSYPALEAIKNKQTITDAVLLISHTVTKELEGKCVVRIYINDKGFHQIDDVMLDVSK